MNIEDEDILNEQVSEETDKEAETEGTVNPEDSDMTENADETEEQDPIEKAQKEIAELKDKWLRSVAEFENYRKRTLKERTELILNGGEKFITAVLPILDDMERAIENGTKTDDPEVLREGMTLIHQKFMKVLEAQGVSRIDTDNADFDTDVHEAVAMVPGMGDDKKGKVIDCLQQGYKLNDKVIRHAKVAVGQ
ncbi:nucleotide exchange factor GrpE [Prevotella aff. ruminicola Tc2-24]|nr:nucleotide exchange factor GrpE [Prevotella aff. ruminicola Tc2-24]